MINTTCPNQELLTDYALGRVSIGQQEEIATHTDHCTACQTRLEKLDDVDDSFFSTLRQSLQTEIDDCNQEAGEKADDQAAIADFTLGTEPIVLGQYQLLAKLGHGGMGAVYQALHLMMKRPVAFKVIAPNRLRDPQAVLRFQREIEAISQLNHTHLVHAYDAGKIEGRYFLAMEFVDGINLRELVREYGPLPVADSCEIARQAALGLQHAHEHDLVHRDIKPSNLMLTSNGIVKVLDLGLAKLKGEAAPVDDMTTAGQIMGSNDFISPEQIQDTRSANARSDIYSLGCTLYFLLAGRAPFSGPEYDTSGKKLVAHAHKSVPAIQQFRPDIPDALAAILDRMLAKKPKDRYASAAEVASVLQPLVLDTSTSATLPRMWQRWIILVGLGLLLLPVLIWGWQMQMWGSVAKLMEKPAETKNLADAASLAATAYIARSALPQPVRDAMQTVLQQHPTEQRWSGKSGATLFAVAAKALPESENQQRMKSAMLGVTHMLAVHEILGTKSLQDQYDSLGLTDATTLRKAVTQASGRLDIDGKAVGTFHLTGIQDNFAVGYVVGDEQALITHLTQPPAIAAVKSEYRDVMHQQARDLMARSNWSDALLLWNHLHQRKLTSQELYLDAAQCFAKLGHADDATKVLEEAMGVTLKLRKLGKSSKT